MPQADKTIAALQTPPGRGGIAVISLIGPRAGEILTSVFRPFRSHRRRGEGVLQLGRLADAGEVIDEAVVHLRIGEAEINIHGGPAVARRIMAALVARGASAVPAPPAATESFPLAHPQLANPAVGRELLEALPLARSSRVVSALTQQWSAGLSALARELVDRDISPQTSDGIARGIARGLGETASGLETMNRLLHPPEVVLAGPPNAGKSTLANAIVGRQVSIVHSSAGTTRDWVREPALLEGLPIWLTDTAGLWEAPDLPGERARIDAESVRRARHRVDQADLVLLIEADQDFTVPDWLGAGRVIRVASKCDLSPPKGRPDVSVSALTGEGLDLLRVKILAALDLADFDAATPRAFTSRQAQLLRAAAGAIKASDAVAARTSLRELLEG